MRRLVARREFVVAVLLLVAGCSRSTHGDLRKAVEDMRRAAAESDYDAMWEFMDSEGKDKLGKQLQTFKGLKEDNPMWDVYESELGLKRADVVSFDTREYFLAILKGLDRIKPDVRAQQVEEAKTSEILSIQEEGDRAQVTMKLASGATKTYAWVREGGDWKCKADVPR